MCTYHIIICLELIWARFLPCPGMDLNYDCVAGGSGIYDMVVVWVEAKIWKVAVKSIHRVASKEANFSHSSLDKLTFRDMPFGVIQQHFLAAARTTIATPNSIQQTRNGRMNQHRTLILYISYIGAIKSPFLRRNKKKCIFIIFTYKWYFR